jgi:hypothetical protein
VPSQNSLLVAAALACVVLPAEAAPPIVIDPAVGGSGEFGWQWDPEYGHGPLAAEVWEFNPTADQRVLFRLRDESYPGDNFSAIVNGVAVPWDNYVTGVGDKYAGPGSQWADGTLSLQLIAGATYTVSFDATPCSSGCSFGGGGTYWITPVPEATTVASIIAGLVVLMLLNTRLRIASAWRRQ